MYNPENICRSCLATDVEFISLDVIVESGTRIDECFRQHMNVEISEGDGLPYSVCVECLDKMVEFRRFYLRYMKSETFLLELYMDSNCQRLEPDEAEASESEASKTDIELLVEGTDTNSEVLEHRTVVETKFEPLEYLELDSLDYDDDLSSDELEFTDNEDQDATYIDDTCNTNDGKKINRPPKYSKLIYCLQCHEKYPTRNELREHFNTAHGKDNARGFCTQCSQTFPSRGKLMAHLPTHKHPATFVKCLYCDKTFQDKSKLTPHQRTHTGEKPYGCTICGRAFSQRSILSTHMQLHTGKTISCPKCDKKFCRKGFLDVHMRVHNDIRPYACTLCDKKYRIKSHLSSHMHTHSDVRSFSCHVCGKSFKEKCILTSHLNIHTKPYKCPKCPLRGAKLSHFRTHLIKMHGIHDDPKIYKSDLSTKKV